MRAGTSSIRATFTWLFGPIVWAMHFFLLYGIATVFCTGPEASRQGQMRLSALALTAMALSGLAGFVLWQYFGGRRHRASQRSENGTSFLRATSIGLAGLATVGIIWAAAGAILIPVCTNPLG